jgi:hypothetical protein
LKTLAAKPTSTGCLNNSFACSSDLFFFLLPFLPIAICYLNLSPSPIVPRFQPKMLYLFETTFLCCSQLKCPPCCLELIQDVSSTLKSNQAIPNRKSKLSLASSHSSCIPKYWPLRYSHSVMRLIQFPGIRPEFMTGTTCIKWHLSPSSFLNRPWRAIAKCLLLSSGCSIPSLAVNYFAPSRSIKGTSSSHKAPQNANTKNKAGKSTSRT